MCYVTKNPDVKIYEVDKEMYADLLVYVVDKEMYAKGDALWFITDKEQRGYTKFTYVDKEREADIKVLFVDKQMYAKWKKPNKFVGRL